MRSSHRSVGQPERYLSNWQPRCGRHQTVIPGGSRPVVVLKWSPNHSVGPPRSRALLGTRGAKPIWERQNCVTPVSGSKEGRQGRSKPLAVAGPAPPPHLHWRAVFPPPSANVRCHFSPPFPPSFPPVSSAFSGYLSLYPSCLFFHTFFISDIHLSTHFLPSSPHHLTTTAHIPKYTKSTTLQALPSRNHV